MTDPTKYDVVKRALDIAIAGMLLLVTLPVQALVAVLVLTRLGRPVLFRQVRPGKDAKLFELLKFRSMKNPDSQFPDRSDADRLNSFGMALRASSLDELPSLWNVLRGDMSIVGPRPLLVAYLERYSLEQARRHEVRPGITGLAQVSGRNGLDWDEKFRLDVKYVDARTLRLDFWIFMHTILKVVRRDGISSPGSVSMSEFLGNSKV